MLTGVKECKKVKKLNFSGIKFPHIDNVEDRVKSENLTTMVSKEIKFFGVGGVNTLFLNKSNGNSLYVIKSDGAFGDYIGTLTQDVIVKDKVVLAKLDHKNLAVLTNHTPLNEKNVYVLAIMKKDLMNYNVDSILNGPYIIIEYGKVARTFMYGKMENGRKHGCQVRSEESGKLICSEWFHGIVGDIQITEGGNR